MIDQGLWHYFKLLNLDCVDLKHEIMQDIFTLQLFWLQGWSMTINVFQRSIIIKISDLDFSIQKWFSEWLKLQKILSLVTIFCNQSLIRKHYQLRSSGGAGQLGALRTTLLLRPLKVRKFQEPRTLIPMISKWFNHYHFSLLDKICTLTFFAMV